MPSNAASLQVLLANGLERLEASENRSMGLSIRRARIEAALKFFATAAKEATGVEVERVDKETLRALVSLTYSLFRTN